MLDTNLPGAGRLLPVTIHLDPTTGLACQSAWLVAFVPVFDWNVGYVGRGTGGRRRRNDARGEGGRGPTAWGKLGEDRARG